MRVSSWGYASPAGRYVIPSSRASWLLLAAVTMKLSARTVCPHRVLCSATSSNFLVISKEKKRYGHQLVDGSDNAPCVKRVMWICGRGWEGSSVRFIVSCSSQLFVSCAMPLSLLPTSVVRYRRLGVGSLANAMPTRRRDRKGAKSRERKKFGIFLEGSGPCCVG